LVDRLAVQVSGSAPPAEGGQRAARSEDQTKDDQRRAHATGTYVGKPPEAASHAAI
jgi:hypothetical protein